MWFEFKSESESALKLSVDYCPLIFVAQKDICLLIWSQMKF